MNRDEMFREYESELAFASHEFDKAKEKAKAKLHDRLKVLRDAAHEETSPTF